MEAGVGSDVGDGVASCVGVGVGDAAVAAGVGDAVGVAGEPPPPLLQAARTSARYRPPRAASPLFIA